MKFLIVGLGNAGPQYDGTRHNIGFEVLDGLAKTKDAEFTLERHAFHAQIKIRGKSVVLIKPTTFMNRSGKAVRYWLEREKVATENLLIISDDIALPHGSLRMRTKGGPGGHNGLTDIIETIHTEKFCRLRFGIGDDFVRGYQADYVLGKWTQGELEQINPSIDQAVKMIESYVSIGPERTMNFFNKK